jgi:aryl-alcohol dehydrogenase-like predicted oxidoreductase
VERAEALGPLVPRGMTLPELALRFILSAPEVCTTIPGMRRRAHVDANLAVADGTRLAPELVATLRPHRWDRKTAAR